MEIRILAGESLGVRGLATVVSLKNRKILIDPGIALGWMRHGFLPHPFQVAVGFEIRKRLVRELAEATDVVFSHFDGDHCPLAAPNPYQLGIRETLVGLKRCRIWAKGESRSSFTRQGRRNALAAALGRDLPEVEESVDGPLAFSSDVPHGVPRNGSNTVMMTRIQEEGVVFVHASDIQLLDEPAIEKILEWKPDILLVSGPPLYHLDSPVSTALRRLARANAVRLAENVAILVIDHHLLRSTEGISWLEDVRQATGRRVECAASFMQRQALFLEAWREELYRWMPVAGDWHERYAAGVEGFEKYRIEGWRMLIEQGRIQPCAWYPVCPIKGFTDDSRLERFWVENYCLVGNRRCRRLQMEARGEFHPDEMLPDGSIRPELTQTGGNDD